MKIAMFLRIFRGSSCSLMPSLQGKNTDCSNKINGQLLYRTIVFGEKLKNSTFNQNNVDKVLPRICAQNSIWKVNMVRAVMCNLETNFITTLDHWCTWRRRYNCKWSQSFDEWIKVRRNFCQRTTHIPNWATMGINIRQKCRDNYLNSVLIMFTLSKWFFLWWSILLRFVWVCPIALFWLNQRVCLLCRRTKEMVHYLMKFQ